MGYTESRFKEYQENMKTFAEVYNRNTDEGIKHVTGMDTGHCAYRYTKIHGAVELMGGWANCSFWIQNHAANYFRTCEKLAQLNLEIIRKLPKEDREKFNEKMNKILNKEYGEKEETEVLRPQKTYECNGCGGQELRDGSVNHDSDCPRVPANA